METHLTDTKKTEQGVLSMIKNCRTLTDIVKFVRFSAMREIMEEELSYWRGESRYFDQVAGNLFSKSYDVDTNEVTDETRYRTYKFVEGKHDLSNDAILRIEEKTQMLINYIEKLEDK